MKFEFADSGMKLFIEIEGFEKEYEDNIFEIINDTVTKQRYAMNKPYRFEDYQELQKGYQALESEEKGLYHPKSEYEIGPPTEPKVFGMKKVDNEERYQLFYICTECNHKGKRFIPKGSIYTNCHDCGKRMNVRYANDKGFGYQDEFSNFFIAGSFKRSDETEIIN